MSLNIPGNDNSEPKITVIQGGLSDPVDFLPPVEHENTRDTGLSHLDGAISLARTDLGTGGASGFFICIGNNPALDFGGARNPDRQGFAVFGKVISGMDVVRKINAMPSDKEADDPYVEGQLLRTPVAILSARRL